MSLKLSLNSLCRREWTWIYDFPTSSPLCCSSSHMLQCLLYILLMIDPRPCYQGKYCIDCAKLLDPWNISCKHFTDMNNCVCQRIVALDSLISKRTEKIYYSNNLFIQAYKGCIDSPFTMTPQRKRLEILELNPWVQFKNKGLVNHGNAYDANNEIGEITFISPTRKMYSPLVGLQCITLKGILFIWLWDLGTGQWETRPAKWKVIAHKLPPQV